MIKALFFDIDGTLVSFATHTIPQSTIEALKCAKSNGMMIFISTGRPKPLINNISEIEAVIGGYITTNGAYCFIGNEVIACNPITHDEAAEAIRRTARMQCACMVVGDKRIGMINENDKSLNICRMLNVGNFTSYPIDLLLDQNILQLTPIIDEGQEKEILHGLNSIESSRWFPDFADFTARGVTKAQGLAAFAGRLGFSTNETMAFGDGGNDATILEAAGIGVAMGNAGITIKEIADYTTTSVDNNGIYNALRYFNII